MRILMKYFPTLFLSFFISEFCCAFILNKLDNKRNLRTSKPKYYKVDVDVGNKFIQKFIAKTKKSQPILPGSDYSIFSNEKKVDYSHKKTNPTQKKMVKKTPPVLSGSDYSLNIEVTKPPESDYYTPSADFQKDCEDMPKLIGSSDASNCGNDHDNDITTTQDQEQEQEYYTPSPDFAKDCEDIPKLIGSKKTNHSGGCS